MLKNTICITLSALLILSCSACNSSSDLNATQPAPQPASDASSANSDSSVSGYSGKSYTFKLAHQLNDQHTGSEFAKDFANEVDKLSGGSIKIEVYGNSQLGTQTENAEAVRMGTVDFCLNDFPTIATVYPMADIIGLPYLFKNYDHVGAFFDSDKCKEMIEDIAKTTGVRIIGPSYDAFRAIFSQTEINSLDNMKNLKIRVPDIPLYVSTFDKLGCSTTIVSFSEIYTALQTGVVTSLENSYNTIFTSALYEQTKYITETNHIFCDMSLMVNDSLLQGLDEQARNIILTAADTAARAHRQRVVDSTDKYKQMLIDKGMKFNTIDTEPFRSACKSVWKQFTDGNAGGQELIDYISSME